MILPVVFFSFWVYGRDWLACEVFAIMGTSGRQAACYKQLAKLLSGCTKCTEWMQTLC